MVLHPLCPSSILVMYITAEYKLSQPHVSFVQTGKGSGTVKNKCLAETVPFVSIGQNLNMSVTCCLSNQGL